ncbi:MAG TPA: hypothetical protein VFX59_14650 [Polyangiales bacterium]|nr:hypothetical protein [Polyangiales bacterium]
MRFLSLLTLLSVAGCYDHRVTQAIMERHRRAKAAEGARIGQRSTVKQAIRYSGRVRFYVSDDYRRQHPQWQSSLSDLVDATASVVGPAFAVELSPTDMREWSPRCDREQLAACLDELAALDTGSSELWVIGVLGDTPRYSSSFETLGMAHLVSSHFVLRDVADLAERKAIDDAFPTHSEDQRAKIYAHRKHHKRLAIFLHEWAHTLGGLHSPESDDLLHASYDDRMTAFGDANAALIAGGLEARYADKPELLRQQVERADASRFLPGEHAKLLAQLDRKPEPAPAAAVRAKPAPLADSMLPAADQQTLSAAQSEADSGAMQNAWGKIAPLVERYPSSYAVQHLACNLSMQLGLMSAAQSTCPRVQQLLPH